MKLKLLLFIFLIALQSCEFPFQQGENIESYNYKIKIRNNSSYNVKLLSFYKKLKQDSIILKSNGSFEKKIKYNKNNPGIWSDEAEGGRDSVTIVFDKKKIIEVPPSYKNRSGKFNWLMEYHAGIKPQRGFRTYNPVTKACNSGTFNYEITNEDYEAAKSL